MSGECTSHHYACDCREAMFSQIRAENEKLRGLLKEAEQKFLDYAMDVGGEAPRDHRDFMMAIEIALGDLEGEG